MTPEIAEKITFYLALVFSLSIHEFAHAWSAKLQGDKTAYYEGRLTINPIAHADIFGTVIFPLIAIFTSVPLLGWAKPVPVNLNNLKYKRYGESIVSAAGPLSNLLMCFVSLVILYLHAKYLAAVFTEDNFFYPLLSIVKALVLVNAVLAFFNLIPFPPLDGASVFGCFLPKKWYNWYYQTVAPYGFMILLVMMFSNGFHWVIKISYGYIDLIQNFLVKFV